MNSQYRLRSSDGIQLGRCFRILLVAMAFCTSMSARAAIAQDSSSQRQGQFTIQGTVVDAHGNAVGDASVRLEPKEGGIALVAETNQRGVFVFCAVRSGNYSVSAEKSGLRSPVIAVSSSGQAPQGINLVLGAAGDSNADSSAAPAASNDAMTFADKPDFTVAGITDWTAAGGHGSDTSLRTSESLSRAAIKLQPDNKSSGSAPGAAMSTELETRLRADLAKTPDSFEANHQLGEFYLRAVLGLPVNRLIGGATRRVPGHRQIGKAPSRTFRRPPAFIGLTSGSRRPALPG